MSTRAAILVVEDSESDVWLIQRALVLAQINNPVTVVRSGDEAVSYLSGMGQYADRNKFPLPGVVLLDLYMPGTSGFDVLSWIRDQPQFAKMRVLVVTASLKVGDINRAYALGANSFLLKPFDFENVIELSRNLQAYWLAEGNSAESNVAAA